MAGNPTCKEPEHKMHMCALKQNGFDKENPDKFKELTENPKYKCGNCGVKVNNSENVCEPVEL
jgi:hypothetical protein